MGKIRLYLNCPFFVFKSISIIKFEIARWLSGIESLYAGDMGSVPGLGRFPGGNPLQYSCLANPMDRGAWRATVHGVVTESDMTKGLKQQQQLLNVCAQKRVTVYANKKTKFNPVNLKR